MTFLERLRKVFQGTTALPERPWATPLDPAEEHDPPIREANHAQDDPGPERVATGELRAAESDEE